MKALKLLSRRHRNVIANYFGVASSLLVGVLLVPVYVKFLGTEAYGIIGFFTTTFAVLQVMDLGFGMTLNRELARRSVVDHDPQETVDLVLTLETVSWSVGLALGAGMVLLASPIAAEWLSAEKTLESAVRNSVRLMGVAFALQWPASVYSGGLMGLQRQVAAVSTTTIANVIFASGAIVLLHFWPTLTTFFIWRAVVSCGSTLAQRTLLWRYLPQRTLVTERHFSFRTLAAVRKFSAGMTGVLLTGTILLQMDKVIVSRFLSLERFGIYMVASTAAALVPQLVGPIFAVNLPPLSQAVATGDVGQLRRTFHLASQMVTTIVHPIGFVIVMFAPELLLAWTGSSAIAETGAPVLRLLVLGALINSVMVPFYAVHLASGWTNLMVGLNGLMLLVSLPYGYWATRGAGEIGAASTWVVVNAVYLTAGAAITFGRALSGERTFWFLRDLLLPSASALVTVSLFRWAFSRTGGPVGTLAIVGLVSVVSVCVAGFAAPAIRKGLMSFMFARARSEAGEGPPRP